MNRKIETRIYLLPSHWACALINGDYSGMDDEEEKEMEGWLKEENPGWCCDCSDESEFRPWNDANNLGGDVSEFTFLYED